MKKVAVNGCPVCLLQWRRAVPLGRKAEGPHVTKVVYVSSEILILSKETTVKLTLIVKIS